MVPEHVIRELRTWAIDTRGVHQVYLVGSHVWGIPHPESDLDVFLVTDPGAFINQKAWEKDLTRRAGMPVQVHFDYLVNATFRAKAKSEGHFVIGRIASMEGGNDEADEIDLQ